MFWKVLVTICVIIIINIWRNFPNALNIVTITKLLV